MEEAAITISLTLVFVTLVFYLLLRTFLGSNRASFLGGMDPKNLRLSSDRLGSRALSLSLVSRVISDTMTGLDIKTIDSVDSGRLDCLIPINTPPEEFLLLLSRLSGRYATHGGLRTVSLEVRILRDYVGNSSKEVLRIDLIAGRRKQGSLASQNSFFLEALLSTHLDRFGITWKVSDSLPGGSRLIIESVLNRKS